VNRKPHDGSGTTHGHVAQAELLKLQKSGQFLDESVNKSHTNSLCNLPDVLGTSRINVTVVGGLLL
jgi:hypothetical protein